MIINVLGMDPSLRNWGFCKAAINVEEMTISVKDLKLAKTASGKDKKTVRKNSDDLRRARTISDELKKQTEGMAVAFVEVPVGSQSAAAMKSYGICVGLLSTLNIPMIQVSPEEVKLAGFGTKTASKDEMIEWATTQHPEGNWLTKKQKGAISFTKDNEHLADALAAIHAGVNTEDFQSVMSIMRMTGG